MSDYDVSILDKVYWSFSDTTYTSAEVLGQELIAYAQEIDCELTQEMLAQLVLAEPEVLVRYEAWIEQTTQLHTNEVIELEEDEELSEEDKEDGLWQVSLMAHLKADNPAGFTVLELMMKLQNQMANKFLGDHVFFEGLGYEGHECEAHGLIDNEAGLPVFEVYCGS